MSAWSGFNSEPVDFVREERAAGETKYSLKKMLKLAGDGAVSFSNKPLKAPLILGIFFGFISFAYLIVAIILCALGIMALMHVLFAAVFLLISAMFFCLGIFGLYLGRIYDESKQRPIYIINEQINF
jgi:dolichol-phosphate mannosyltransferase